ncbi:NAD-dependent epimerase/dehydratase family protein [Azospirillum isscasi]|uniref:NAD-dependent epimerase/dehydratase family protein n=1 Tax=Azospirillum isscasi TaxID=3053926 RepID=A0ABU0WMB8_9PROT|nr:NAD-dependent epimerase/dehydratase family protein [Azospirillum isscasi]MDQ2104689.1 NAD-dependent epimerase/dehydratase family protein [Azospirillum isscasi]
MGITLVTGGSGFIGGHLVAALAARGERVRILDRQDPPDPLPPGVEFRRGSILDEAAVARALDGVERVYHLAAVALLWDRDPAVFDRVNRQGTRVLLDAAARAPGLRRFIHCSTEAVMIGHPPPRRLPPRLNEDADPGLEALAGPYCRSKYRAEQDALAAAARGLPVVVVNPTAPIGPGDRLPTPPNAMLRLFRGGGPRLILDCVLNLVDVRDVAQGMILAAERGRIGERYILGGTDIALGDLARRIDRLCGREPVRRRPVPPALALAAARVEEWLSDHVTRRPPTASVTGVRLALGGGGFDSGKAMRELGYTVRPLEASLREALE